MSIANDYLKFTRTTAIYPKNQAHAYLGLAICDEIGELVEKMSPLRSIVFGASMAKNNKIGQGVLKESGDVAYYIARCCDEYDHDFDRLIASAGYIGEASLPCALDALIIAGSKIAGREKKAMRDGASWNEGQRVQNEITILEQLQIAWGALAVICRFFGFSMEHVMFVNREKLEDRRDRGVIQGDGDNR